MGRGLAAIALLLWAAAGAAQGPAAEKPQSDKPGSDKHASDKPNGLFLVAKPELLDPNFARTVVLVTQTDDSSTVGVIINRPTVIKLSDFVADPKIETSKYRDRLYLGGPVMRNALIAVFQSETRPTAAAFHVLRKLYMTLHPDNVTMLLSSEGRRYRLYAGFSGWAPRQLESEFDREGWFVLPADEEVLFRADTTGMWEEMLQRVRALKTRAPLHDGAPGFANAGLVDDVAPL